jgi:hypothetical protein
MSEGLAYQMAQPNPAEGIPGIEEVIQLLIDGAEPQQLVQMGIPQEVIMQAMQVLEQQLASQAQEPATEAGLAQTMAS